MGKVRVTSLKISQIDEPSSQGVTRVYVCSCFGITEQQVRDHAGTGACTPRQIASACKAGTDCGGCVRRIQALLGRGACPRRELIDNGEPEPLVAEVAEAEPAALPEAA